MFREVLEKRKNILGDKHPDAIAVRDLLQLTKTSETGSGSQTRVALNAEKQPFRKKNIWEVEKSSRCLPRSLVVNYVSIVYPKKAKSQVTGLSMARLLQLPKKKKRPR